MYNQGCWVTVLAFAAGWIIISSVLLFFAWNKVIAFLTPWKK